MLRKIKKEPEPPVVTVDSDSDNEFIQVYKDDVATEVSLENNRIMIADLVALFPNFHGLQVVGNGVNRLLSKTKHAKKGYFPAPEPGWAAVKILVLVVEPSPLESTLSTPRSTPVEPGTAAENVKPAKENKSAKEDKPPKEDVPPPAAVTPVRVTDEDIFDRFNVTDMEELLYLPQFYRAPDKDFLKYRDKFLEVFRGPIMALGRDSFNLPFLYDLSLCKIDVSRLLSSLEGIKALECDVCGEAFVEPQSAFKHYCSISHGEKYLSAKNCYANEIVDFLKSAKERSLFPPPMYPPVQQAVPTPIRPAVPSLMANIIHPAAVAIPPQSAQFIPPPKLVNTCPLLNQQRQTKWDQRPAPIQLPPSFQQPAPQPVVRIPINYHPTVAPQQHQPYSNFQKNNVGGNFAQNPVTFGPMPPTHSYRQSCNTSENANHNDAGVVAKNWNLNHASDQSSKAPSNAKHGKRKRLDDSSEDEKEVPRTSRIPLAEQQPPSSRSKIPPHGEDDKELQRPVASNLQSSSSRSKKSSSNCYPSTSSGETMLRPDNDSEDDKSHPEPQPRSSLTKISSSADTKGEAGILEMDLKSHYFKYNWRIDQQQLQLLQNNKYCFRLLGDVQTMKSLENVKYRLILFYHNKYKDDIEDNEKVIGVDITILNLSRNQKMRTISSFTVKSAGYNSLYSDALHTYNQSSWGEIICPMKDFFLPEKKYIVDGKCKLVVKGVAYIEEIKGNLQIIPSLYQFLWESENQDFTICVKEENTEKKYIKVHKVVLSARSPVFKAMLNSQMIESVQQQMDIVDFDFTIVETAIKHFYEQNIDEYKTNVGICCSLLRFADKYDAYELKKYVEDSLEFVVNLENVCMIANCSLMYNSIVLYRLCLGYLKAYKKEKFVIPGIKSLDMEILNQL